jgi:hypothetical protein
LLAYLPAIRGLSVLMSSQVITMDAFGGGGETGALSVNSPNAVETEVI